MSYAAPIILILVISIDFSVVQMKEYRLQFKPEMSSRAAKDMILFFARYGDHGLKMPFRSDAELADLAEQLNMFRTGVAGLLIQLHQLFEQPIPAAIIRAYYAPDVEVVEIESNARS